MPTPKKRLRILVTNDDGVEAPGIRALAGAVAGLGHDVLVVAPMDDQSGVGSARVAMIGRPIRTNSVDDGGITFVGIAGTPALAVTLATVGAFGPPPDLVVSGINRGHNVSVTILHSGTVAAALTAATQGLSALAISIGGEDPQHLPTAAAVAAELTQWLVDAPQGTVLNVNVPDRPAAALRGIRRARLAPISQTRLSVETASSGEARILLRTPGVPPEPDTDTALLAADYVAVTPISGVTETDLAVWPDLTVMSPTG